MDSTLASTYFDETHDVLRCKFSIHWEMLWLQCFPFSVLHSAKQFRVLQFWWIVVF